MKHRQLARILPIGVAIVLLGAAPCSSREEALVPIVPASPVLEPAAPGAREEPPERIALLVSIADYPDSISNVWTDLAGPTNDMQLVKSLLTERFDFKPDEIKILQDEQATHEAIVRTFYEWLIKRAGENTEVVFWYCGHGSRVPDESGRKRAEHDNKDSTLLTWDSRLDGRTGSFDLTDDELSSLLLALTEKTSRVTMITDSCHSGGVMRGAAPSGGELGRVRAFPDGETAHDFGLIESFWPEDVPFHDDNAERPDPEKYVHISACGPHQLAREWCFPGDDGGTCYGALTFFLTYRMREAGSGQSYESVLEQVERWIAARLPDQALQYEGKVERELFGGRFQPRPPGHEARLRPGTGQEIEVEAGSLHGLRVGSKLAMTDWEGTRLGEIEVLDVGAVVSRGLWKGAPPAGLEDTVLLARESSRPGGRDLLPVQIGDDKLAALAAEKFQDRIELVPSAEHVHSIEVIGSEEGARVRFLDPAGTLIWPGAGEDRVRGDWLTWFGQEFGEQLDKELKYRSVNMLAQESGLLKLRARFAQLDQDDFVGPDRGQGKKRGTWRKGRKLVDAGVEPINGGLWERASSREFLSELPTVDPGKVGCLARLDVTNDTGEDVYPTVLSVMEDRSISLIWPPTRSGPSEVLPAGETVKVYVELMLNEKQGLTRPMRDRYLVIATRQPADFHALLQNTTLRSGGPGALKGVPPLIENALKGTVTRGSGSIDTSDAGAKDFGITTVDVQILRSGDRM